MENNIKISKWNKELGYSVFFFITAIMWYFVNPIGEIRDLIETLPHTSSIYDKLFNLGIYPLFYSVSLIMDIGFFLFILLSIYIGVKSLKKIPTDGKRKIFNFIPQNLPGWLTSIFISVSLFYGFVMLNFIIFG